MSVSCVGGDIISIRDDSWTLTPLSPTASSGLRGVPGQIFFTGLLSLLLSAGEMLLLQKTPPYNMYCQQDQNNIFTVSQLAVGGHT